MDRRTLRAVLLASAVGLSSQPAFAMQGQAPEPPGTGLSSTAPAPSPDGSVPLGTTTSSALPASAAPIRTDQAATVSTPPLSNQAAPASDDIVVTARRTAENLQRVPVADTVLPAETLAKNNIVDSYGILSQIPAVQNITRNTGAATTATLLRIRGVNPVAYYFNDAPLTNAAFSTFAPFFDLGSVQVLKGPQGTLFGQASNAGAIVNTPRRPGTEFGGYLQVSAGNYHFKSIEGAVDLPLVKDHLFLRVAGISYDRQGYIRDALSNAVVDGRQKYDIGRATLVWRPSDAIENVTLFQMERVRGLSGGASGTPGDYDFFDNPLNRTLATLNGMTFAQLNAVRDQILANQVKLGPYKTQGWSVGCPASGLGPATTSTVPGPNLANVVPQPCAPGGGYIHNYAAYNTTTVNVAEGYSIKNILSRLWGTQKFMGLYDNDGTRLIGNEANPRNLAYTNPVPKTFSEEMQLHGKVSRDFDFVVGGFFYDEKNSPKNPVFGTFTTSLGQNASKTFLQTRSYSFYGQGNYDLSSIIQGLTVTGGVRHTWDAVYRRQVVFDPTTLVEISQNGGRNTPSGEAHFQATSYTVGAQYQVNGRTMVYVTNAKGYSIGGLQNNAAAPLFRPDTLNNLEVGLKTTVRVGDVSLRANLAGYYGWYDNVKVTTFQLLPATPGSNVNILTQVTANAAAARIKGFEAEFGGSIGRLFEFNVFASYQDPQYTRFDYVNPLTRVLENIKNQPFPLSPKWKLGFSPTFNVPVDPDHVGRISVGLNATYRTKFWANPVKPIIPNDPNNIDTGLICKVRRTAAYGYGPLSADGRWAYKGCAPSFYNVNATVNWSDVMGYKGLRLGVTVTNLTQNDKPAGINSQYDTLNANGWQANEPRMWYFTVGYSF